jgi:tRNA (guanine-N7-)-methyltransferase
MRRLKRLPMEQLSPCLLETPAGTDPIDWAALFGNDNPIEIEVGFGKGLFLLNEAQRRPDVNFFGIEIERKYQLYTATRIIKRGLTNVRLACADARLFLRAYVPQQSVQAIHVYFPDPWWKHRHLKRRLFDADFVVQCQRALKTGGRLHIATDVPDYFEIMITLLREYTSLIALPGPDSPTPAHDLDYLTNFERKFRKEGKPIHRAIYERGG